MVATLQDEAYTARALFLAARGQGTTSPNPMVGAVVVSPEGVVVGSGYHEVAGGPHAEVVALEAAGERARGATLYCTLEPCCHVGRTGPCTRRIVGAGIARVVASLRDPNPLVAGGGFAELRASGIDVVESCMSREAARLNRAFLTWVQERRPYVIAKAALTSDNAVAGTGGARLAITSAPANRIVHRERAAVDAIAVGSGTIQADDPLLTARGAWRRMPLTRVIFDRSLRTSPTARLFSTSGSGPVIIMSTEKHVAAHPERVARLESSGAVVEPMPDGNLLSALRRLGERGITSLLVEGGPRLHTAFCQARLVDAWQLYCSPARAGHEAIRWLGAAECALMGPPHRVRVCGPDVRMDIDVHGTD
jgi:diaminohydroxyphosphoribosylaminopyrimidine deaminase/5-amino-6-(5-phosphoribosylamino)uracil reductase